MWRNWKRSVKIKTHALSATTKRRALTQPRPPGPWPLAGRIYFHWQFVLKSVSPQTAPLSNLARKRNRRTASLTYRYRKLLPPECRRPANVNELFPSENRVKNVAVDRQVCSGHAASTKTFRAKVRTSISLQFILVACKNKRLWVRKWPFFEEKQEALSRSTQGQHTISALRPASSLRFRDIRASGCLHRCKSKY